jgi:hypothetical protein
MDARGDGEVNATDETTHVAASHYVAETTHSYFSTSTHF